MSTRLNQSFCIVGALLSALLFATGLAPAATNVTSWIRLPWSSADGLPNNTVNGLAQSADGFIWVGTPSGMARFDGVQFEELPSTNFIANPNRGVLALISGRGGGVHLGMDRGAVVSLSAESQQSYIPAGELSNPTIYSMTEDAQGDLWVCYRGGSVRRVVDGQAMIITPQDGLPEGTQIASMACEANGKLWFHKRGQLGAVRQGKLSLIHI